MTSSMAFVLSVMITIGAALLVYIGGPKEVYTYLKTNLGVTKGIVMFIVFGMAIAFCSEQVRAEGGSFLNYADVYLGLDRTNHTSPQCNGGPISDRLTSNGGLILNLYRSDDHRFHANTKYTHHSCAFNDDRNGYDAVGIELKYRFFNR